MKRTGAWIRNVALVGLFLGIAAGNAQAALPTTDRDGSAGLLGPVNEVLDQVQSTACPNGCGPVGEILDSTSGKAEETLSGAVGSASGNPGGNGNSSGGNGTNPGPDPGPLLGELGSPVTENEGSRRSNRRTDSGGGGSQPGSGAPTSVIELTSGSVPAGASAAAEPKEDEGFGINLGIAGLRLNGSSLVAIFALLLLAYAGWRNYLRPSASPEQEGSVLDSVMAIGRLSATDTERNPDAV